MKLDELQRLAENACVMPWERPRDVPYAAKAEFQDAMSPDTAKKLIAVALAAQKALAALEEAQTYTASPSWSPSMTLECKDAEVGLRTALEELK